ncbi:hypothetical protein SUGI_0746500 [Cryptomeria japonica]|nr:hypothetical protein SUGI_0746500 [Cryptomeria japonica]
MNTLKTRGLQIVTATGFKPQASRSAAEGAGSTISPSLEETPAEPFTTPGETPAKPLFIAPGKAVSPAAPGGTRNDGFAATDYLRAAVAADTGGLRATTADADADADDIA